MALQLYIGNKNYSSWSMRPWVLMKQADIEFEEVMLPFDSFDADSEFKQKINAVSPVGKVPVLVVDGLPVWDSLAIAEYLAERFAQKQLWPIDVSARARARSICSEMHSGFNALRNHCPLNIEASLPETGSIIWRDQFAVRDDIKRLDGLWTELLTNYGGPMLFGNFSIADAFFAPVCSRIQTYALPVSDVVMNYIERVHGLQSVKQWVDSALAEKDFVDFDEPYRIKR